MGELELVRPPPLPQVAEPHEEGLQFQSVTVEIAEKRILWGVSGGALPGRLLAVMGPSGSGKTTLLNALAGHTPISGGHVTLNGQQPNRRNRRKISYVLQADIFFPNLTLRETLRFAALLRLPSQLSFREKLDKVEEIIAILNLQDCANTIIGNVLVRGLSGGEKKRANIGCELLTNPTLLLLDEPTSGLDSSSALSLLKTLCSLAKERNKIVVASIHQPSSQLYHMFHSLLLLAKGKSAYFGPVSGVLDSFARLGLHCTLHYNPADYMLELVSDAETRKILIGEDPCQDDTSTRRWSWVECWRRWKGREKGREMEDQSSHSVPEILDYDCSPRLPRKQPPLAINPLSDLTEPSLDSKPSAENGRDRKERRWPTPWYWQFLVLTVRTFRQSRHVILSPYNFLQTLLIAAVVSLVWFQVPLEEESISDRYGALFFTCIYWSFTPLFVAVTSFPSERVVVFKERASGCYHLSAYYMAKSISELPLILALPTLYIIPVYWITGFNGPAAFFGTWFILILTAIVSQSLGLLIGAVVMEFRKSIVVTAVLGLSNMLLAGFYVQRLPQWLHWSERLSYPSYSFDALLQLEFTSSQQFSCAAEASSYVVCNVTDPFSNATISGPAVLDQLRVTTPFYANVLIMVVFVLGFRTLAYLALRYLHRR